MPEAIDVATIKSLLPYGDEALFLKSAEVIRTGDEISIQADACFDHPAHTAQHASHFPGQPILAGHFTIEAILQTAALLAVYLLWLSKGRPMSFSLQAGVKSFSNAVFTGQAHPYEDQVTIEVTLGELGRAQCTFTEGIARVGNRQICALHNIRGFAFPRR